MEGKVKTFIKYFLNLQLTRLNRKAAEWGMPLPLLIIVGIAVMTAGSYILFKKTTYAGWIIALLAVTYSYQLIRPEFRNFLDLIGNKRQAKGIELTFRFCIALPFIAILLLSKEYVPLTITVFLSLGFSFIRNSLQINTKIPTPFKRIAFEAIIGFRTFLSLIILIYSLFMVAIYVDNANLGIAMVGFVILVNGIFYLKIEPETYVWIFHVSPQQFIMLKLKAMFISAAMLILPLLSLTLVCFPKLSIATFAVLVYGSMISIILLFAKWAVFPKEINVVQSILIGISLFFPPLLFFTIPSFYKKAVQNIRPLLLC